MNLVTSTSSTTQEKSLAVAIVGCRKYSNYQEFTLPCKGLPQQKYLSKFIKINGSISTIISGGASGADSLAEKFANENKIKLVVYKANWQKYGRSAGPIRNTLIVKDCDVLIAFPSKSSRWAWDSVKKAKKARKNVTIYKI